MGKISTSMHFKAPVERVFDVFTDLRNAAGRIEGITELEVLTDGPVGRGTRFRETRMMFKKSWTEEMEITDFEPNGAYVVGCESCGSAYATTFRFSPDDGGTRVDLDWEWKPLTFVAKLMSPMGKLMSGSMTKCFEADMNDLRRVIEEGDATPSSSDAPGTSSA